MTLLPNGKTGIAENDFDAAIRSRWQPIDSIGVGANAYQAEAANRRQALKSQQDMMALQAANTAAQIKASENRSSLSAGLRSKDTTTGGGSRTIPGTPGTRGTSGTAGTSSKPASGGKGDNFAAFMSSIGVQESGGNYNARNGDSGAMGKYQIMPANLGGSGNGWDQEALGYDISASQFMKSPKLQEQIASFKLQKYYNAYGPAGAAIAWYAGPGAAQKYMKSGNASRGSEGNYPTQYQYVQDILRRMGL